ncbi:sigma 54-interacting transcriptional regulator [Clostridium gasigenes]|uniref:sigma 54-interacting transcriptional regulator n=1 Tax=Clostridium gasigenes TaxID=94869 RepID=UPI001C0E2FFC|nr:sigma 54-interacting transcriptional regulator [Clostridium gasigenes]MBU3133852.1 sigma 54-interacting transcriptional regulator [Clostridium gasigenes]
MTNKENVLLQLEKESVKIDGTLEVGITSNDISIILGIKRNIVSQYLNELYREGKVIKVNTRPVYFIDKSVYEKNKMNFKLANNFMNVQNNCNKKDNVFSNLVGHNGSLSSVVQQCKAATNYPTNGLPILLIGDSGVGKSYIAQLIFDYAREQEIIEENSKFVIFNCAEYANNPELLSAALFGACKGAYTGADNDRKGLIEEADEGYLFLDEIHRLSSEGQEKLFIFLDKGIFRRVGESGKWRKAKVRVIFATTENPEMVFLKTFLRRIPLVTNIPSFSDRPIVEKLELINNIYRKEAISINKGILLEENVINIIINSTWSGNIGKLINTIKITCANAFSEKKYIQDTKLKINISHLPKEIISNFNSELVENNKSTLISISENNYSAINVQYEIINNINKNFVNNVNDFRNNKIREEVFWEKIKSIEELLIRNIEDNSFYYYSEGTVEVIRKIVTNNLNMLNNRYGIKARSNSVDIIVNSICSLPIVDESDNLEIKIMLKYLQDKYKKLYRLSEKIVNEIEGIINIKLNYIVLAYITTNLGLINKELEWNLITAVIIAHGKSTASSIASVANNMLGMYIYDSIDMPINVSTEEIAKELREYIKNVDAKRGLILLVDMGSLQEIYLGIKDEFNGDIAIINNVSSLLALDVGNKIINKKPIKEIIKESVEKNIAKYNYIPATSKKKDAIITTCSTGIGTAEKIKSLLEQCLKDKDITILAYDYDKLKAGGENEYIFNEYRVRLIIGLSNPNIENVPYLSLEDMIMGNDKAKILNILNNILDDDTMEELNNTLLKAFTINNVITHLIILNPDKILTQVQDAISTLEFNLKIKLPNSLKIGIYIHTSCMVERLVIRQPLLEHKNINEFEHCNRHFIKCTQNAFSVIENFYKIEIPVSEIAFIYDIINRIVKI